MHSWSRLPRFVAVSCSASLQPCRSGFSAPFAKRLLDDVRPEMLAGVLYLGVFAALGILGRRSKRRSPDSGARMHHVWH